ncbi:hypothetical protein ACFQY5_12090 [Paeniroseomonas aquatica]|uniref:hypothetical protein n=1 Tax=Paeniroseomonas aquatica TaxID=373043 RepID=UPI0036229E92
MTKSKLLASTLGLALLAGPVLAQQADAPMRRDMPMQNGAMPMPAPATTGLGAERMPRACPTTPWVAPRMAGIAMARCAPSGPRPGRRTGWMPASWSSRRAPPCAPAAPPRPGT